MPSTSGKTDGIMAGVLTDHTVVILARSLFPTLDGAGAQKRRWFSHGVPMLAQCLIPRPLLRKGEGDAVFEEGLCPSSTPFGRRASSRSRSERSRWFLWMVWQRNQGVRLVPVGKGKGTGRCLAYLSLPENQPSARVNWATRSFYTGACLGYEH